MKLIISISILLFLTLNLQAEYLATFEKSNNTGVLIYCVKYYYFTDNNINFTDINNQTFNIDTLTLQKINFEDGYINNNGVCLMDRSKLLGLNYEDYNFLMAQFGIVLSFLIGLTFILAV